MLFSEGTEQQLSFHTDPKKSWKSSLIADRRRSHWLLGSEALSFDGRDSPISTTNLNEFTAVVARLSNASWLTNANYAAQKVTVKFTMFADSQISTSQAKKTNHPGFGGWLFAAARPWLSANIAIMKIHQGGRD